jgi:hypothetical protein
MAEAFLEFRQAGDLVRVAAIDADTGLKAIVFGPVHAARADLERLALAKLEMLRAGGPRTDEAPVPSAEARPGRWA